MVHRAVAAMRGYHDSSFGASTSAQICPYTQLRLWTDVHDQLVDGRPSRAPLLGHRLSVQPGAPRSALADGLRLVRSIQQRPQEEAPVIDAIYPLLKCQLDGLVSTCRRPV